MVVLYKQKLLRYLEFKTDIPKHDVQYYSNHMESDVDFYSIHLPANELNHLSCQMLNIVRFNT